MAGRPELSNRLGEIRSFERDPPLGYLEFGHRIVQAEQDRSPFNIVIFTRDQFRDTAGLEDG